MRALREAPGMYISLISRRNCHTTASLVLVIEPRRGWAKMRSYPELRQIRQKEAQDIWGKQREVYENQIQVQERVHSEANQMGWIIRRAGLGKNGSDMIVVTGILAAPLVGGIALAHEVGCQKEEEEE